MELLDGKRVRLLCQEFSNFDYNRPVYYWRRSGCSLFGATGANPLVVNNVVASAGDYEKATDRIQELREEVAGQRRLNSSESNSPDPVAAIVIANAIV